MPYEQIIKRELFFLRKLQTEIKANYIYGKKYTDNNKLEKKINGCIRHACNYRLLEL